MLTIFFLARSLNDLWEYSIHDNTWTFLGGNTTSNNSYAGTLSVGVPTSNELGYPSFGYRMAGWTDSSGVYFLNGRADFVSRNQVLRYTTDNSTGYWTLFCPSDLTGRRDAGTSGNSWLFGGYGTDRNSDTMTCE